MFTLKAKIVATLANLKTFENSLNDAVSASAPNIYETHLKLQIAICEDSLAVYFNEISPAQKAIVKPVVYSID